MDITFVANDTLGGVEPYLALASEAAVRGHAVRVAAPPQYEAEFSAIGARFGPLRGEEAAQEIAAQGRVSLREMGRHVVDLATGWAVETAAFAAGTDVVASGIGGMPVARPVAQAIGAPLLRAHLQPLEAPSGAYPGPFGSRLDTLGRGGQRLSHAITAMGTAVVSRPPERAARDALGLDGAPPAPWPTIVYGFSSAVVPVASDAGTTRVAAGYWARSAPWDVDPRVRAFVERPGPVVSVGFGSMVGSDPRELRALVTAAARRAGTRVVLLTGWGALDEAGVEDDDVLVASSVAHAWLFPRMSATVHHGGAGTTGAALTAGKPTVIVPFGADQPFWAGRAHRLGVSPAPLPRARLTVDRLAEALEQALSDQKMRNRAEELGGRLRHDRGVQDAVDLIEAATGARA